jgi:hypothetical protein
MSRFDLDSLLDYDPPSYLCQKCFAINQPSFKNYDEDSQPTCSVCHVKYIGTRDYPPWHFAAYLDREAGTGINFSDPIAHGKKLATIARELREETCFRPRLMILNDLLLAAEQFVHFMSWNINHVFIGSLKLISHRVPVRGIVSRVGEQFTMAELIDDRDEAPQFRCEVFNGRDAPHTKLIIVDGLVELEGSVNLTLEGWRKSEKNRDKLRVETDIASVFTDNNRYFSSIWAERSDIGDYIDMRRTRPRWTVT